MHWWFSWQFFWHSKGPEVAKAVPTVLKPSVGVPG